MSVCHLHLGLFWYVENCASTLEEYGSLSTGVRKRVASIASHMTLKPRDFFSGDTSAGFDLPVVCSVTPGSTIESYRGNSLVAWVLIDESSACFV